MKSKEEIRDWLLKNCIDEFGNLDLSNLDFGDFDGDVLLCNMKVKENLYQYAQEVSGDLMQSNHKVKGNLYQDYQEVKGSLYQNGQKVEEDMWQDCQKVQGDLYQDDQKVEGAIFQDNITNADIDEKINALKEIISELEKQKVVDTAECAIGDCSIKLGQLEDIEEELGIDLITLFKALKYGVYYFSNGTQLTRDYVFLMNNYMSVGTYDRLSYSFITAFEKQPLLFNDYGKTWALTKEELE